MVAALCNAIGTICRMKALKCAVTSGSLADDIRAAAAMAQALKFSGLVVPSRTAAVDLTELSKTGSREYRHIVSSFDLQLVAIECTLGKDGFSLKSDIDRSLSRLSKVITAAVELGLAMVCLDLGPLPIPPLGEKPKPKISPEQAGLIIIPELKPEASAPDSSRVEKRDLAFEATVTGALQALGQIADRLGTIIALRSSLAGFASLEHVIVGSGCPWFGVDLDTVHMLADEWSSDEIFSRLGSHIRHVRARDATKGTGGRVLPCAVGAGSVDWPALLGNLDAADYRGFVTIDSTDLPNRATAAAQGLQVFARLK